MGCVVGITRGRRSSGAPADVVGPGRRGGAPAEVVGIPRWMMRGDGRRPRGE